MQRSPARPSAAEVSVGAILPASASASCQNADFYLALLKRGFWLISLKAARAISRSPPLVYTGFGLLPIIAPRFDRAM